MTFVDLIHVSNQTTMVATDNFNDDDDDDDDYDDDHDT